MNERRGPPGLILERRLGNRLGRARLLPSRKHARRRLGGSLALPARVAGRFQAAADSSSHRRISNGFTLIEVTMATLITGLLLVAALNTVGSSTRSQIHNAERARAATLGDALLNEIVALPYYDPQTGSGFGRETGEGSSNRADFDDVDDYHIWVGAPPKDKAGNTLASGTGLIRFVLVNYAEPSNVTLISSTDKGVKRIRVAVIDSSATWNWYTAVVTNH